MSQKIQNDRRREDGIKVEKKFINNTTDYIFMNDNTALIINHQKKDLKNWGLCYGK